MVKDGFDDDEKKVYGLPKLWVHVLYLFKKAFYFFGGKKILKITFYHHFHEHKKLHSLWSGADYIYAKKIKGTNKLSKTRLQMAQPGFNYPIATP